MWFAKHAHAGWATCPFTETAFVRILSNPASSRYLIRPAQAVDALRENLNHPSHEFWPDDLTAVDAVEHKARFATFDRGIAALASAAGAGQVVTMPGK